MKQTEKLLQGLTYRCVRGKLPREVTQVAYDSRNVEPGGIFVCIRGSRQDGHQFIWESVRRGEEENIFPYQEEADAMFNSALIYELAVLKQYAEPLLFNIQKDQPEYYEAKRLLKFLDYFLGVSSEHIPQNSIIREFIGGSIFKV